MSDTTEPMSIEEMCAVIDQGKRRLLYLEREVEAWKDAYAKTHDLMRQYFDALYTLETCNGLVFNTETRLWRAMADEIDCGRLTGDCCYSSYSECPKAESEAKCGWEFAEDLRSLANAIDAWRQVKAAGQPAP